MNLNIEPVLRWTLYTRPGLKDQHTGLLWIIVSFDPSMIPAVTEEYNKLALASWLGA
jgi:hypothetical protein